MTEHVMLTVLSVLVTITIGLVTLLIGFMLSGKNELLTKIDKMCLDNEKDHNEMWDRVNHNFHNGGGNVVIPTAIKGGHQ